MNSQAAPVPTSPTYTIVPVAEMRMPGGRFASATKTRSLVLRVADGRKVCLATFNTEAKAEAFIARQVAVRSA